jgi:hypothetical protein
MGWHLFINACTAACSVVAVQAIWHACYGWLRITKVHIFGASIHATCHTGEDAADADIAMLQEPNALHAGSPTYACLLGFTGNGNMASSIPNFSHLNARIFMTVFKRVRGPPCPCIGLARTRKALAFTLTSLL